MSERTKTRRSLDDLLGEPTALDQIKHATQLLGGEDGDTAMGFAFYQEFKDRVCCIEETNSWRLYKDGVWEATDVDALMQGWAAGRVVSAGDRFQKAGRDDVKDSKDSISRAAMFFADRRLQERALKQARPHLLKSMAVFDQQPYLLAVANGILDLRAGRLIEPQPFHYLLRRAPVTFDPAAQCPSFMTYLEVVQPDPAMREFMQRATGYTLMGDASEERFFFAHGEGSTGKSLFIGVVSAVLGPFVVNIPSAHLTASRDSVDPERVHARLLGSRLALSNETREGMVWNEVLLKELSAYDQASARNLYQGAVDYQPTHTLWIRGNHVPGSLDSSDGLSRRYTPIAFDVVIPEHARDRGLLDRIKAEELSGVLNWALGGARKWSRDRELGLDGLRIPARVKRERDEYKAESDWFGRWLAECATQAPDAEAETSALYESYRHFCQRGGVSVPTLITFGRTMKARGFAHKNASGRKPARYVGVAVIGRHEGRFPDEP